MPAPLHGPPLGIVYVYGRDGCELEVARTWTVAEGHELAKQIADFLGYRVVDRTEA
jgi:hypothetical protein